MKHLLLLANPNPRSFTHAVTDELEAVIATLGHTVERRDLYAMQFNPVLSADDVRRFFSGELPDDVRQAQADIRDADVIHLVFPLWWTGLPAILKGYVDRVFAPGFAYGRGADGVTIQPLLTGRRAFLWTPHGNLEWQYEAQGMYAALGRTIDDGILRYAGIDVRAHTYYPGIRHSTPDVRSEWLAAIRTTLCAGLDSGLGTDGSREGAVV